MKNRTLTLHIDKPCEENWNTFTPAGKGRFCGSCSKVVIDFTRATDEEIFQFIKQKPAHACGRFKPEQLKTYLPTVLPGVKPGFMLLKAGLLSLLLMLISKPGTAQSATPKAPTEIVEKPGSITTAADYLVKGIVRSKEDNSPLPGVSVVLKGTAIGTSTRIDGSFEFPERLKEGDVLGFYFIGLRSEEVRIRDHQQIVIKLEMDLDTDMMGEISIAEPYTPKESFFKRTWTKFRQLF